MQVHRCPATDTAVSVAAGDVLADMHRNASRHDSPLASAVSLASYQSAGLASGGRAWGPATCTV